MTTYQGDSAVYKLDLKQAASLLSDNSYPIYTIFAHETDIFVQLILFTSLCLLHLRDLALNKLRSYRSRGEPQT